MLFKLPVKALKCASSAITCPSFTPKSISKPECFSGQSRLWMTVTRKPPGRNWLRSACSYSCRSQGGLFNWQGRWTWNKEGSAVNTHYRDLSRVNFTRANKKHGPSNLCIFKNDGDDYPGTIYGNLMCLLGAEAPGKCQFSAARPRRPERVSCGEGTQETDLPWQGKGGSRPSSVQPVHSLGRVLAVGKVKHGTLPSDWWCHI